MLIEVLLYDMLLLFQIGFLPVRIWDILDIVIVGFLMYQIYRLLRGSIAFNIFIGVLTLYAVWWLVNQLDMDLLAGVLNQFVSVGIIIIVIIFQQEIRRFLLFLGDSTLRQRSNFLHRLLDRDFEPSEDADRQIRAIRSSMLRMSRKKIGALIVLTRDVALEGIVSSGTRLDADISEGLIESIFHKSSPLHDGAVLIGHNKILAAGCILPVSENPDLPKSAGLRHRAAVGISERYEVAAFIVSEETGILSYAFKGKLHRHLDEDQLSSELRQHI